MEISNNEEVHNTFIQNTEPSPEKRKRNYSEYDDNSQLSDVTVDNEIKRQRMNTNPQENDGLYDDLYGDIYSDVDIGGKRKRKGNRQSKRNQVNSKKTKRIKYNKKGIKYNKKGNKITKKGKKHNKTSKRKMRR
jgi:hypothetical protein